MNEWLVQNIGFPEVIAVLGVLGGIIAGLVNLRDRRHRSTVENLNARMDTFKIHLDEARRQESKAKDSEAEVRNKNDVLTHELAIAREEISKLTATVTFDGVAFPRHQSDPPSSVPVCAECRLPMTPNGPYLYCPNGHKITVSIANRAIPKYVSWFKSRRLASQEEMENES